MSNTTVAKSYLEENTIRFVALQVVIISVILLAAQSKYLALLLAIDFAVRAFTYLPSPLAAVAKFLVKQFNIERKPVFSAPKKFAAAVGFVFSLSIFLLFQFELTIAAFVVGGVLVFCAVLESFFKICIGCYVYDWLIVPFTKKGIGK